MSYTKPQVVIDLDEYNSLKSAENNFELKKQEITKDRDKMTERSREFVSALAFLEERNLLDEFNNRISKKYKLESVGINKDYKKLIEI